MSDDIVRHVWVVQDRSDGKWLPKRIGDAWTSDAMNRVEFMDRESADDAKKPYQNAEVIKAPMTCRESAYEQAEKFIGYATTLSAYASVLGCDEAVDTVFDALLRHARKLRAGDNDEVTR